MGIDINCDMGEGFGNYQFGSDEDIFPYITSCNVACGFHAGDPLHIERTLMMAKEHAVQVGAHPSYPDLQGFGRRYLKMEAVELKAFIKYQVAAIQGLAASLGTPIRYVKPHGALYNRAADDEMEARTVVAAIRELDDTLALVGLAGSVLEQVAQQSGLEFIPEAFADRRYNPKGRLVSRQVPEAVIEEPGEAAAQVVSIITEQKVYTQDYQPVEVHAKSICIHGDNPEVIHVLKAIHEALKERNIDKRPFA